jgi:hypothetical protein
MLVEFTRALQQDTDAMGEDDGLGVQREHKIAIKPALVSAVFESTQAPNVSIIRLADGRGFQVRGTYTEVMEKLRSGGSLPSQSAEGEQDNLH